MRNDEWAFPSGSKINSSKGEDPYVSSEYNFMEWPDTMTFLVQRNTGDIDIWTDVYALDMNKYLVLFRKVGGHRCLVDYPVGDVELCRTLEAGDEKFYKAMQEYKIRIAQVNEPPPSQHLPLAGVWTGFADAEETKRRQELIIELRKNMDDAINEMLRRREEIDKYPG